MSVIFASEGRPASIYVHIPFCERLCPYCDFAVAIRKEIPEEDYVQALIKEWEARKYRLSGRELVSVYFGGGTPSILSEAAIPKVLDSFSSVMNGAREVCVEANPTSVTEEKIRAWAEAGVTRVSLGVQTFSERYLRALGRNHNSDGALRAVELLLCSPLDIGLDFIVGGPGNDRVEVENDLRLLEKFGVNHVSAYQMTIEENTAFGKQNKRGELKVPKDDTVAELLDQMRGGLEAMGLEQYEVSNFGRAGVRSVHNQNYWRGGEYLGLGVGAHSLSISVIAERRANSRNLKAYMADPTEAHEVETLYDLDHCRERLFLGMRSVSGFEIEALRRQFPHLDNDYFERVATSLTPFVNRGWLTHRDELYQPTKAGLYFSDSMAEAIFEVE